MSSIEWRIGEQVLVNATNQTALDFDFPLVSDDLQQEQYTCRAETTGGRVYTETVEIAVVGMFQ